MAVPSTTEPAVVACSASTAERLAPAGCSVEPPHHEALEGEPKGKSKGRWDSGTLAATRERANVPSENLNMIAETVGASADSECAALLAPSAQASREELKEGTSGGGEGCEDPAGPETKRARIAAPAKSLGAIEARLTAAAELARSALLVSPGEASRAEEEAAQLRGLERACQDAKRKQRALDAQYRAEQAAWVMARASLKALEAARAEALELERQASPALEEFDRVVAEGAGNCSALVKLAEAVAAKGEDEATTDLFPTDVEPGLAAACKRLREVRQRAAKLEVERGRAEADRDQRQTQLAILERRLEEGRRLADAEAAVQGAEARVAERRRETEFLVAEVALLEAAAAAAAGRASSAEASLKAGESVRRSDVNECMEGTAAEAAVSDVEAQCLAALGKRAAELQQSIDEKHRLTSELEARCAAASAGSLPCTASATTTLVGAAAPGSARGPALDVAKPEPFLAACAPQRLFVSSDAAPEVAGEYRMLQEGANGRPAFKATGSRAVFLLWTSREGGCWIFAPDLGTEAIFARSLQLAWTALPDELMAGSWTRGAWGARGVGLRIVILRG